MAPIDITYNDEVGFLTNQERDWKDWIFQLLLLAKDKICLLYTSDAADD